MQSLCENVTCEAFSKSFKFCGLKQTSYINFISLSELRDMYLKMCWFAEKVSSI